VFKISYNNNEDEVGAVLYNAKHIYDYYYYYETYIVVVGVGRRGT